MATSGTYNFSIGFDELLNQAVRRLGGEQTIGVDLFDGRIKAQLLLTEIRNKNIPLHAYSIVSVEVPASTASFVVSAPHMDISTMMIAPTSAASPTQLPVTQIPTEEYLRIPHKNQRGRPTQFALHKLRTESICYLWPVPSVNYTATLWTIRRLQDISLATEEVDIPHEYLPAFIAGLAYYIGQDRGEDPTKLAGLRAEFETLLMEASEENRERVSFYVRYMPQ